jgi:cyclophilin family peptidyl-prolyl cis-trans isomerase
MDLFDDEQVTTADKIDRPERAIEKQAIDDFMKRNPMAGGGMLVQPGFGGTRQGYAKPPGFQPGNTANLNRRDGNPGNIKALEKLMKEKTALKNKKVKKFVELVEKGNSTTDAKNKVIKLFRLQRKKGAGTPPWMTEGKNILVDKGVLEDIERGSMKIIGETEDFSKDKNIQRLSRETIEPGIKKVTYKNKTTGNTFVKYKPLLRSNTVTVSGAGFDNLEQAQEIVKNYNEANPKKTAVTLKLEENLRTLFNNKRLAPLLKSGVPDKKYLKVVQDILDLNVSQAEDKLKQLGEAVKPDSNFDIPGIDKINKKKATNISNFYKSKSVSKKVVDQEIGKSVGEKSLKNLRQDVQKQLPFKGGIETFETDEAKAKMGSFRLGSKPYSIFGQVIDGRLNQGDKMRVDAVLSTLEESVQKALRGELFDAKGKKISPMEAVNKYNAVATEAEKKFNYQNMRNFKPVRIPRISLESPNKTIANKAAYTKYKQFFDKNYEELGYSFKIPKDLKPIPEIAADLKNKNSSEYKNLIKNIKQVGSKFIKNINEYDEKDLFKMLENPKFQKFKKFIPRLVSNQDFSERRYASANNIMSDAIYVDDKTFAEKNPVTTGAGLTTAGTAAVLKATGTPIKTALGKAFRGAGTPIAGPIYAGMNIADRLQSGSSVADAVIDPMTGLELSFPGLFKENLKKITTNPTAQKILSLGRFGRALTPIGAGITAAGLAKDYGEFVQRELERKAADPEAYRAEQQEQMGMSAADGGRAGFKIGTVIDKGNKLRKGILELINKNVRSTPEDTTSDLDALIKKTLDEDFFDKKDRIIDNINAKISRARAKGLDSEEIGEGQIEFYDDITKSNFRTKTGPFFDRRKRAGGGILKQAGDSSGPPPKSGPMSEGLQGLMKRGIKT